jgi:hypothetical protein
LLLAYSKKIPNRIPFSQKAITMSVFDPDNFMETVVTEAGSTSSTPIPAGEYEAMIKEISKARNVGKDEDDPRYIIDVTWELINVEQSILDEVGRDSLTVRQAVWLDITQGRLDMGKGKNVGLNKIRDALNQNTSGKPWSPPDMQGVPARVVVSHRTDKNDPSKVYAEVRSVGRFS